MTDTEIYGTDYSSDGFITSNGDIGLVTELANAEQAIRNRLLTRLGTYPNIDTDYGSEVYQALGEKINNSLVSELRVYVENCMLEEPREYAILDLDITKENHDTIHLQLQLQLVDGSEIGFEETLNTLG
jgi:phage baseplate assembly protein W